MLRFWPPGPKGLLLPGAGPLPVEGKHLSSPLEVPAVPVQKPQTERCPGSLLLVAPWIFLDFSS